jgi:virulence-associated protein VapD
MKKQELITRLIEKGTKSTNLKTASNAEEKRAIESHGFEKVKGWLSLIERKESNARMAIEYAKKAKSFGLSSRKEYLALSEKASDILSDFQTGHSMGCYRTLLLNNTPFQWNHNLDNYAKSYKFSATYGSLKISLNKKELRQVKNIQGVWTIESEDGSAKWLESSGRKSTFSVEWVEGYVFKDSHSNESLDAAKALQELKDIQKAAQKSRDGQFVGAVHMRAKGACMPGIIAFCNRHGLNVNRGYSVGFLKSFNDLYSVPFLK